MNGMCRDPRHWGSASSGSSCWYHPGPSWFEVEGKRKYFMEMNDWTWPSLVLYDTESVRGLVTICLWRKTPKMYAFPENVQYYLFNVFNSEHFNAY